MLWKQTFWLLLAIFLLLVFCGRELSVPPAPARLPESSSKETEAGNFVPKGRPAAVFSFAFPQDVFEIVVSDLKTKTVFSFEKQKGIWMMTSPVHFSASPAFLRDWLAVLGAAERVNAFPIREKTDLAEFGLEAPELEICLKSESGKEVECLEVGKLSPFREAHYARLKGVPEIFLFDGRFKSMFDLQSAYDVLQKNIFPFVWREAEAMMIGHGKDAWRFKKENENWYQIDPFRQRIEPEKMEMFLRELNNLHVREFVDGAAAEEPVYGFAGGGSAKIEVRFSGGNTGRLLLGAEIPERFSYYGHLESWPSVFLVSKEKVEIVFSSVWELASPPESA